MPQRLRQRSNQLTQEEKDLFEFRRREKARRARENADAGLTLPGFLARTKIPALDPWQEAVITSTDPRLVLLARRQVGKSTCVAVKAALQGLNKPDQTILIIAPSLRQSTELLRKVRQLLNKFGAELPAEAVTHLELANGSRYIALPGNASTVVGISAVNLLLVDEAALISRDLIDQLTPMLISTGGQMVLLSNAGQSRGIFWETWKNLDLPWRRITVVVDDVWDGTACDWAGREGYEVFIESADDEKIAADGPYFRGRADWDFLEIERKSMGAQAFATNYLCRFNDSEEGKVFRRVSEACQWPVSTPEDHAGHYLVSGLDWGKDNDYTVHSIGCVTCLCEVELNRFRLVDWPLQQERIAADYARWGLQHTVAEANSIGSPNIAALRQKRIDVGADGQIGTARKALYMQVGEFDMTGASKGPVIQGLVLAIETGGIGLLDDPVAREELEMYRQELSAHGNVKYGAPAGFHDDTVIARALLWRAMQIRPAFSL